MSLEMIGIEENIAGPAIEGFAPIIGLISVKEVSSQFSSPKCFTPAKAG